MKDALILAIDQGTTSTRAIAFDASGQAVASAQAEFTQFFPDDGWVEHDPEEIWRGTLDVCAKTIAAAGGVERFAAIGITNQRETTVLWERGTGKAIHRAIVWQDRRTASICAGLRAAGCEADVTQRTGLLLDPYFSGTKIAWTLDKVGGARNAATRGDLAFGTTDCFLLWRLTGGKVHATDATNACRTLLYNLHSGDWDDTLLATLNVPRAVLPEIRDCAGLFGETDPALFGKALPVRGIAGDQHAAAIGQACFAPGMLKSTYGTGCFALLNTGDKPVPSSNRLLTTLAYQLDGKRTYALEGSIFVAGAAVQWLRDGIGLIKDASETGPLAAGLDGTAGVYLVPAFTGLGAPYWDAEARGALFGLTRDTGVAQIVRATLESVAYQTNDLIEAMRADGAQLDTVRVDGGMVVNDWVSQCLANITDLVVDRPEVTETTALGAAYLAGLSAGMFDSLDEISTRWQLERRFTPSMDSGARASALAGWQRSVARVRSDASQGPMKAR